MGFAEFFVDFYVGNSLQNRKQFILPIMMAIFQCVDICQQMYKEEKPIKLVFQYEEQTLEYKNPKYIKFEKGE